MKITATPIEGCFIIEPRIFSDQRGKFVKPYHIGDLKGNGIEMPVRETYYSVSKQNVVRGLHFQLPPKATAKLVTCLDGLIFDAVVDLRKNSKTYQKTFSVELSSGTGNQIYIPEGLAHGFCTLSKSATVLYFSSEMFSPDHDAGICWNSAGITWPVTKPLISEKDAGLPGLNTFDNPF